MYEMSSRQARAFPATHIDPAESSSRFVHARMQTAAHAPAAQYVHFRDMGTWLIPDATAESALDGRPD
jgi:hypothetical protein